MASNDITRNPSYLARQLTIDRNTALTATGTAKGLHIDYDHTGIAASGQTITGIGLDIDMNCDSVTHVGIIDQTGIEIDMVATTDGTAQVNKGIDITVSGADVNHGLYITVPNGASDSHIKLLNDDGYASFFTAANGVTTIATTDSDGAVGHLNIEPDGHVEFDGCAVGFDLETPTYNASDTDVSFITGNKQFVTFGAGNITDLNLIFPETSGNFVLLIKQDGTGSRTITNYKAWDLANDDAADGSATVKFAGGSNPDLTDDANHVDIISIFWDADNQIAYGVASLDFQF